MKRLAFALALLSLSGTASAHARWKLTGKLKPRTNATGLKEPSPCGGAKVDESRRATLVAGETVEVEFEETINHPGYYKITFSKDGSTGFEQNVIEEKIDDDQNAAISGTSYHQYKYSLKVPSEACDKCAFQLIQFMTENPASPSKYYSCADVKIVAAGSTSSATGTGTGAATGEKPAAPTKLKVTVKKVGEP